MYSDHRQLGCAASTDVDVFFVFDHSINITASEALASSEWVQKLIDYGLTNGSAMGFSAGSELYSNIRTDTWLAWKDAIATCINGPGNFTNQLQYGLNIMLQRYENCESCNSTRNRIGIMLAAEHPCGPFFAGTPYPDCFSNSDFCTWECPGPTENDSYFCNKQDDLISDDIRLVVIYSSPAEDFDYSCVTQSAADVFYISDAYSDSFGSLNNVTSNVLDIMCPLDTYSLTLSEFKVDSSSLDSLSDYDAPFIEILNENSFPIRLDSLLFSGLVTGTISSNDTATLKVNQYLVIYDADIGSVSCSDCTDCTTSDGHQCDDAIYIPCGSGYNCTFSSAMVCTLWNRVISLHCDILPNIFSIHRPALNGTLLFTTR